MDGLPTSISGGVAGALASHQVARDQAARRARQVRQTERRGSAEAAEAADAPVERAAEAGEITSRLPDRQPPDEREHLDVVG